MKISIKKLYAASYRGGSDSWWDIYVSDEDAAIFEKEVGNIFSDGAGWVWGISFVEALGIFPMADGVASSDEAKKATRKYIKECYANWQKKSPPEQDQAILFHYLQKLQEEVELLKLTEEMQERMSDYMESLQSGMQFDECVTDNLSLNCVLDPIDFEQLLDAIVGVAYSSYLTHSQGSVASSSIASIAENIRCRVEAAGKRLVKEIAIARQEAQN